MMAYENRYYDYSEIHIEKGDKIRIKKGTVIFTTSKEEILEASRTYTVTVNHVLPGRTVTFPPLKPWHPKLPDQSPSIRWVGKGGYWMEADINDVEKM